MSNKTYNQYCAITHALDQIGERWTLVLVRNLLLGPKRFSDLMRGAPGISTNTLAERLKSLEADGLVKSDFLPPPAASTVYRLTETGYGLADALGALARWGSLTLGEPQEGQLVVDEGIGFMVVGVFQRADKPTFTLDCALHIRDPRYQHTFAVRLSPHGVDLIDGPPSAASVEISMGLSPLVGLSSKRTRLADLVAEGQATLKGGANEVHHVLAWVDGR